MKENIVVVGGYGHVGQTICRELGKIYPGKVFAAGRSLERSRQFCSTTGGKAHPLQLDIHKAIDPDFFGDVKLVVMCLDQTDTAFVEACFAAGAHYIDVSASHSYLEQVRQLHPKAVKHRAAAILSVGLSPGLTNLLAARASSLLDDTHTIDISVMLGLGDQHGKAAIEWTVDNLGASFHAVKEGRRTEFASFTDGRKAYFGTELGRKTAYRFNFSDQHSLPLTLGVPTVSTRLCFDSAASTKLIAWMSAAGVFRLLKLGAFRSALVQLFGRLKYGTRKYAVKIDAHGTQNGKETLVECFLSGEIEADITARVAASAADYAYRTPLPYGVYDIEQAIGLDDILPSLAGKAVFDLRVNGATLSR